jgi:hypothetical protein
MSVSGVPSKSRLRIRASPLVGAPTLKSSEIFVRIERKFGLGSAEVSAVPGNLRGLEHGIFTDTRARSRNLLHPESPATPREIEDGLGSSDGFRPKSGRKREAGGMSGDALTLRYVVAMVIPV